MTTDEKLAAIRKLAILNAVRKTDAGVGLEFYVPGRIIPEEAVGEPGSAAWQKNLVVNGFYSTLEEAVDAEYEHLLAHTDAGWQLIHATGQEEGLLN